MTSSKMKVIEQAYEILQPEERFRLVLHAMAKNENDTLSKLVKTCPKKNYAISDSAYTNLVEFSQTMALTFGIVTGQNMSSLRALRLVKLLRWPMKCQAEAVDGEIAEAFEQIENAIKAQEKVIKTWYVAFSNFSEQRLRVEFDTLVEAWLETVIDWGEEIKKICERAEVDREEQTKIIKMLEGKWIERSA